MAVVKRNPNLPAVDKSKINYRPSVVRPRKTGTNAPAPAAPAAPAAVHAALVPVAPVAVAPAALPAKAAELEPPK